MGADSLLREVSWNAGTSRPYSVQKRFTFSGAVWRCANGVASRSIQDLDSQLRSVCRQSLATGEFTVSATSRATCYFECLIHPSQRPASIGCPASLKRFAADAKRSSASSPAPRVAAMCPRTSSCAAYHAGNRITTFAR